MKTLLKRSWIISMLVAIQCYGQSVDSLFMNSTQPFHLAAKAYQDYYEQEYPEDTTEGGGKNELGRLVNFMSTRVASDAPVGTPATKAWNMALNKYTTNMGSYCNGVGSNFKGNWRCMGPFINSYGGIEKSGRVESIWVDPGDVDHILAGAQSGGLWETTDGGQNWQNKTDAANNVIPATMGIYHIAVNPLNHNIIYLNTGIGYQAGNRGKAGAYTVGVVYSTDGGTTWQQDHAVNALMGSNPNSYGLAERATKMAYMPGTDKLFAIFGSQVFYRASAGANWQDITPANPADYFTDIEFTQLSTGKAVIAGYKKSGDVDLYVFNTSNSQWSNFNVSLPAGYTYFQDQNTKLLSIWDISVSPADVIYLCIRGNKTNAAGTNADPIQRDMLVTKSLSSTSVSILNDDFTYKMSCNNQICRSGTQFIEVSPANPNIIYTTTHDGRYSFFRYDVSSLTFSNMSSHADGRCLVIFNSTSTSDGVNDVVFGGTDGGVAKKSAGQTSFKSIVGNGLCITQFYGFAQPEDDENIIMGGAQDNGGNTFIRSRTPQWQALNPYGDGYLAAFARNGVKHGIQEINYPRVQESSFATNQLLFGGMATPDDDGGLPEWGSSANQHRPIVFNEQNREQIGYYRVWTKEIYETEIEDWEVLFDKFPEGHIPMDINAPYPLDQIDYGYCRVLKFIIPEKQGYTDMAYLAYRGEGADADSHDPLDPARPWNGRLYRALGIVPPTNSKTYTVPSGWENITPPIAGWWQITDMVINPDNPAEIFVCFGSIEWGLINSTPADSRHRVYYSSDYGTNWTDISKGLPALPANKLIYHAGVRTLYVGTDVGVFKCNFNSFNPNATLTPNLVNPSVQWVCFNEGLPTLLVQDMDLNYCSGKLRIATFGRGIWETDVLESTATSTYPIVGDVLPQPTEIVTSTTVWNSSRRIMTGIKVTNNSTLTISGSGTVIHMPYNGKIVVDTGSKLIIDGARITNDCNGMWYGIQALGQTNERQLATKQATVEIMNGAVIEHARFAVSNCDENWWSTTGGIIRAENSLFRNNHKSIQFHLYHNHDANGNLTGNVSYFVKCTFDANSDYKGDAINYGFDSHISMWEVEGVSISGCKFFNRTSLNRGYGIITYNAGFKVSAHCALYSYTGSCTGTVTRSEFRGFKCGILAEGDGAYFPMTVDQVDFDSNSIGVRVKNVQDIGVFRSNFTIGNGKNIESPTGCYQNIGTFTTGSYRFRIEENSYTGVTYSGQHIGWENLGAVTEDSYDGYNNEIYKNTFTGLSDGAHAIGKNHGPSNAGKDIDGLMYFCNNFSNNHVDIAVTATPPDGIAGTQGTMLNNGTALMGASNTFSTTGDNISNSGSSFNYLHYGSNQPTIAPAPSVSAVTIIPAIQAYECSSRIQGFDDIVEVTPTEKATLLGKKTAALHNITDLTNDLTSHMDGGDQEELITSISSMNGLDAQTALLEISPYVSETVLRHVIDNSIMSQELMMEVLMANPDVLRRGSFMSYLEENEYDINELMDPATVPTERTEIEVAIAKNQRDVSEVYRLLFASAKSGAEHESLSGIPAMLNEVESLASAYELADFYYSTGLDSLGDSVYNNIPVKYTLGTEEEEEYHAYGTIRETISNLRENQLRELNTTQAGLIEDISDNFKGKKVGQVADVLLYNLTDISRPLCVEMVSVEMRRAPKATGKDKATSKTLNVFPNPAREQVVFSYNVATIAGNLRLTITNVTGKVVKEFILSDKKGLLHWYTTDIPNGIYFYKLTDTKQKHGHGKVVIAK